MSVGLIPLGVLNSPWGEEIMKTEWHAIISVLEPRFEKPTKLSEEPKLVYKL